MKTEPGSNAVTGAFEELERGVHAALETYSNVHRGRGHYSMVSTHLFEQARGIVLEHLGLSKGKDVVIFGTPRTADTLMAQLRPGSYRIASSPDVGLPLGVRALAVERKALPKSVPFLTGGGTARLVSPDWVMWATAPDRFEAGTPAIVNVIAFAKALLLTTRLGDHAFEDTTAEEQTAAEILHDDELDRYTGRELMHELRQTLIGRGVRVPTVERGPTLRQPGQRRQHAYIRADMDRCPPDVVPAQTCPAGGRSGGEVRRRRCARRALGRVRRDLHVQHD